MADIFRSLCAELVDIATAHCNPDDFAVGDCAAVLFRARAALRDAYEAEADNPPERHPDPEPFQAILRERATTLAQPEPPQPKPTVWSAINAMADRLAAAEQRIEALEASANSSAPLTGSPAPTGGLVAKVTDAVVYGIEISDQRGAIDAILAVAEWLDTRGQHGCSLWLREEVQRHG
jgi:hypothetical protein